MSCPSASRTAPGQHPPPRAAGPRRAWTTGLGLILALLAAPGAAQAEKPAPQRRVLYVQPLGRSLPQPDVAAVQGALEAFTGLTVRVLPRLGLPPAAWYAPRRRWRAERLLDFLAPRLPADGLRILGLTGADISTTKDRVRDWGVIGLATLDGRASVISAFRCRKRARGPAHARERLAKTAVHEIGHTLGLPHCPTLGCLMEDARGKVATTDGEYDLCPACRDRLRQAGHRLPPEPVIPWPRPRPVGPARAPR